MRKTAEAARRAPSTFRATRRWSSDRRSSSRRARDTRALDRAPCRCSTPHARGETSGSAVRVRFSISPIGVCHLTVPSMRRADRWHQIGHADRFGSSLSSRRVLGCCCRAQEPARSAVHVDRRAPSAAPRAVDARSAASSSRGGALSAAALARLGWHGGCTVVPGVGGQRVALLGCRRALAVGLAAGRAGSTAGPSRSGVQRFGGSSLLLVLSHQESYKMSVLASPGSALLAVAGLSRAGVYPGVLKRRRRVL